VVRGKILSLREEDYATAALLSGASTWRIMWRHLLPGFTSNIIVGLTLQLPNVVLGETALSYLGLGLRRPVVSWGVLLYDAQNVQAVAQQPWLLSPAVLVVVMVLAFNFVGDGLRDAADPYVR
jgi:peptide/nickel transport system permease protein